MRKITLLLFTTFMLFVPGAGAQQFRNIIGPLEVGNAIAQSRDSGFVIGGQYNVAMEYMAQPTVTRLTKNGALEWCRMLKIPGQRSSVVTDLEAVISPAGKQDGYIGIAGGGDGIYAMRLTNAGEIVWSKKITIDSNKYLEGGKLKPVYSSTVSLPSFYIIGYNNWYGRSFVLKLDPSGNIVWQKSIKDSLSSHGYSIGFSDLQVTGDGGCIVSGHRSFNTGSDAAIYKFSSSGNVVFAKVFRFDSTVYGNGFGIASVDSGYVITSQADGKDNIIFKVNAAGVLKWSYRYKTAGTNPLTGKTIATDISGNILVAGNYYSWFGTPGNAFLMKLDAKGTPIFAKEYHMHSGFNDIGISATGYYAVGVSDSGDYHVPYTYVIQTDTSGNISQDCTLASITCTSYPIKAKKIYVPPYAFLDEILDIAPIQITSSRIAVKANKCVGTEDNIRTPGAAKGQLSAYAYAGFSNIKIEYKVAATDNNNYTVKLYNLKGEVLAAAAALKANQPILLPATRLQQGLYIVALLYKGELVAQQKLMITK